MSVNTWGAVNTWLAGGGGNIPPTSNAGPDQSVAAGASVTLTGVSSSDSDGTIASYLWSQTGGDTVTLSSTSVVSPTFTAPSTGASQDLTFQLVVTDNEGATGTDTVVITVAAIPVVSVTFSGLISNRTIAIGGSLSLSLSGNFSGTETPFTYSLLSGVLPTGLTLNASTGVVSGTPSVLGLSSGIVVRATDTALSTADTNSFSINVVDGVVVPVDERLTQSSIAAYLRTQGFTGGNNDVIIAWLKSEGFEAEYNDAFNNYLGSLGYIGGFTDKYAAWQKEAGV